MKIQICSFAATHTNAIMQTPLDNIYVYIIYIEICFKLLIIKYYHSHRVLIYIFFQCGCLCKYFLIVGVAGTH